VGARAILDVFGAQSVHGFDLDARMIALARRRLAGHSQRVLFWTGDAAAIAAADASYDAVFDFGVLHHLPEWRPGVSEIYRVLRPGGRFYGEEILAPFIRRTRYVLDHPQHDRFDAATFCAALAGQGFESIECKAIGQSFAWFVARRPN
jgi:ubiquinone/menaquinone biosynthesis C-methylase UbiE